MQGSSRAMSSFEKSVQHDPPFLHMVYRTKRCRKIPSTHANAIDRSAKRHFLSSHRSRSTFSNTLNFIYRLKQLVAFAIGLRSLSRPHTCTSDSLHFNLVNKTVSPRVITSTLNRAAKFSFAPSAFAKNARTFAMKVCSPGVSLS